MYAWLLYQVAAVVGVHPCLALSWLIPMPVRRKICQRFRRVLRQALLPCR